MRRNLTGTFKFGITLRSNKSGKTEIASPSPSKFRSNSQILEVVKESEETKTLAGKDMSDNSKPVISDYSSGTSPNEKDVKSLKGLNDVKHAKRMKALWKRTYKKAHGAMTFIKAYQALNQKLFTKGYHNIKNSKWYKMN